MGRIEELKKLADICRSERTVSVGDFFNMDDIDYLIYRLQKAEEALKLISEEFSVIRSIGIAQQALEQIQKE